LRRSIPCFPRPFSILNRVPSTYTNKTPNDNEKIIEDKLMCIIDKNRWSKTHHQMVLFGRYICKAKKPDCYECTLKDICNEKDKN
jgi:endonuclease III